MPEAINLRDLQAGGYLAEANRRFFHPLGLALSIDRDDDGNDTLFVQDDRTDLEGWYFTEPIDDIKAHAAKIDAELQERAPHRLAALGYPDVQPL